VRSSETTVRQRPLLHRSFSSSRASRRRETTSLTEPAPTRAELYVLTERVALRVMTWLRKRGYAKEDADESNAAPERSFAETLALVGTQRGTLENVKDDTGECEGPARATTSYAPFWSSRSSHSVLVLVIGALDRLS
jgi:hypothetical protein